jgi:7,8-dihydropterin-6-yl-methyl-4-(beta-D-ribofuranosyl)aminobenzene 5'-phosphate synthase
MEAIEQLRFTILFDNRTHDPRLKASWGFACLIEWEAHSLLFDTGSRGDLLVEHMRLLEVDPGQIDHLFISHDHWDHQGGMASLLAAHADPVVHLLNGFSRETRAIAQGLAGKISMAEGPAPLLPGCFSTGAMGEEIPEQALILKSVLGPIVMTGCAHPGLLPILDLAQTITGEPIAAILGGFHLHRSDDAGVRGLIAQMAKLGVEHAGPCHCSGDRAIVLFREAFGDRCLDCSAGSILTCDAKGFVRLA